MNTSQILKNRPVQPRMRLGIPQHPMVKPRPNGVQYHRRRRKIHVSHPERQDLRALVTLPLQAARPPALNHRVKINCHRVS